MSTIEGFFTFYNGIKLRSPFIRGSLTKTFCRYRIQVHIVFCLWTEREQKLRNYSYIHNQCESIKEREKRVHFWSHLMYCVYRNYFEDLFLLTCYVFWCFSEILGFLKKMVVFNRIMILIFEHNKRNLNLSKS